MNHLTRLLPCLLPFALALAPAAQVQPAEPMTAATTDTEELRLFRLRSGDILWGSIAEHDAQRVTVRRLDHGGLARLPWSYLAPAEEAALRLRFGYADTETEELLAKADRLVLRDGTEIIGLIDNRTDQFVYVRARGNVVPVNKGMIAGPATLIEVPALEIYTREELYQSKLFELQSRMLAGGTTAVAAHLELAQYSERLYDFAHAVEHYEFARESDAGYEQSVVEQGLAKALRKAEVQEQLDLLAEIDLWRARRRFDDALAGLATFEARYPNSPVLEEFDKTRSRVMKYQEIAVREEVVRSWHYWTVRRAKEAARTLESFEAVLGYLDEKMGAEVVKDVTEGLQRLAPGIREDEVRRLWEEREGGRFKHASYGYGTWLLGEDRARAEVEQETRAEAAPKDSAEAQRQRLEERIQRYQKNQELARKNQSGSGADLEEPEDFWARWKYSNKAQWILAYHVEFSGDFAVEKARLSNCRECGGTGARSIVYSGGAISGSQAGERLIACPTCHSIGVSRRIRYR